MTFVFLLATVAISGEVPHADPPSTASVQDSSEVRRSDRDVPKTKDERPSTKVIVVVGAQGTADYGREFRKWADRCQSAARAGGANVVQIGWSEKGEARSDISDRDQLRIALKEESVSKSQELWLIFFGHGTFDRRSAKFNMRGVDVTAADLSKWLDQIKHPVAIINCASSSGPFLKKLSRPNRVIVTSTKSGYEQNYSRFGAHFSQAINDTRADLDKDGQTSLLESFLMASRQTSEFYKTDGRLETEHALLDDNGDGQGAPATFFRGIHPVRKPAGGAQLDGYRAHQFHLVRSKIEQSMPPELRRQRDELELSVIRLRETKADLSEADYLKQLESLLLPLARLYAQISDQ